MAHEIGHNLGMDHDFNGSPGVTRLDSKGRTCTNVGGVMDYFQVIYLIKTLSSDKRIFLLYKH